MNLKPALSLCLTQAAQNKDACEYTPTSAACHSPLFGRPNSVIDPLISKRKFNHCQHSEQPKALRDAPTMSYLTGHIGRATRGAVVTLATGKNNEYFKLGGEAPRRAALLALAGVPLIIMFTLIHDLVDTLPKNIVTVIKNRFKDNTDLNAIALSDNPRESYRQYLREVTPNQC